MRKTSLIAAVASLSLLSTCYANTPDENVNVVAVARSLTMLPTPDECCSEPVAPPVKKPSKLSQLCALLSCMGKTAVDVVETVAEVKGDKELKKIAAAISVGANAAGRMAQDDDLTLSKAMAGTGAGVAGVLDQIGQEGAGRIVEAAANNGARIIQTHGLNNGLPANGRAVVADMTITALEMIREQAALNRAGMYAVPPTPRNSPVLGGSFEGTDNVHDAVSAVSLASFGATAPSDLGKNNGSDAA
jgi:hypothetical protein